ncbi:MAG TPA: PilT/PilU family type 4a pilus ATPase [Kiritimatiellia bacterium]|nr:PilT/PilU family type 4a pilus ATPase [Kiritimatiellia bacterium]
MDTIEELLKHVMSSGASDLLLTAGAPPQMRLNRRLKAITANSLTPADTERLALSILNETQAKQLRERRSIDLSRGFEGLSRFRFNIYYQRDSLAMAARCIPSSIPSFSALGLPNIVRNFALQPHGLFLVTGSAGSGKSTTLAAMIDYINEHRNAHVICLEDPIEYLHRHRNSIIDQREIFEDAHSFNEALLSVFRQSPDVIMIGEMRDVETVALALTLAETGHLILATLHTQDTTNAITRIVDVFPPAQQQQIYTQLSMVLTGVVSQTLIPTRDNSRCVLAYEVLNVNFAIRNLIRERQVHQVYSVIQTGRNDGMITMNESLRSHVQSGSIDTQTAMERSPRPRELANLLGISYEQAQKTIGRAISGDPS